MTCQRAEAETRTTPKLRLNETPENTARKLHRALLPECPPRWLASRGADRERYRPPQNCQRLRTPFCRFLDHCVGTLLITRFGPQIACESRGFADAMLIRNSSTPVLRGLRRSPWTPRTGENLWLKFVVALDRHEDGGVDTGGVR